MYLDNDTWVHRLHPLVRLLGMMSVFVAAFVAQRPVGLLPILVVLLGLLA